MMGNEKLKTFGVEVGQGKYHEEIVYSIALIYAGLYNNVSAYLGGFHLTPAQMNLLMTIKHQGHTQGMSQKDISQRLLVTASNITRMLIRLERDGLIERTAHTEDKRVTLVKITQKGSELLDKVWPQYDQKVRNSVSGLSVEEQKVLSGLLQKWLGKLVG